MNLTTVSFVQFSIGYASTHFVKYSTAVMMYFSPDLFSLLRKGPTKSMAQILNEKLGFTKCMRISFSHNGWHIL
jgi:hypothetical protein